MAAGRNGWSAVRGQLITTAYSYDSAGRLTGYEGLGYSYGSAHIHAVDLVNGVDRYDYDANGNMTVRNKDLSSQQTLTWDHENRLSAISGGGLPTESYLYDADGARIKKTSNGVSTYYVSPLFEVTGTDVTRYYYFNGQRVAMHKSGTLTYLHSDHLASTVLTTDTSLDPSGDQRYYAYGKQRDISPVATDHQFTGQKLDGTGLQYYNARYYDPTLGTFISPDSIVPDAATLIDYNRYAYSRANPLKFNDPSGHCATLEGGAPDMEGDGQCWGLAYSIYGYGATGSDGFSYDWKISADQWLQDIAPQPFATAEYLTPFASRYDSEWRGKVGLTSYVPNQAPPPQDIVAEFDKRFAAILTACARQIGGACGVSTGINGQALIIGGRFSLDGYIDQNGNRMYYLTPALGPQISVKPLGVSGSNSYIFAPGATVDSFKGWGGSTGGSISVVRGMAVDAVFTVTNTGPKPLGFALGSQSGWNAEVHAMVSYSFVLYDSQHK